MEADFDGVEGVADWGVLVKVKIRVGQRMRLKSS